MCAHGSFDERIRFQGDSRCGALRVSRLKGGRDTVVPWPKSYRSSAIAPSPGASALLRCNDRREFITAAEFIYADRGKTREAKRSCAAPAATRPDFAGLAALSSRTPASRLVVGNDDRFPLCTPGNLPAAIQFRFSQFQPMSDDNISPTRNVVLPL
jgi:hypothetical protein